MIANLLSNAQKFTPEEGEIRVTLCVVGQHARFEVSNSGPGMPDDQLEKIFAKFYQIDHSSTRKVGGSGLGLAISRAIVEEGHGGKIWAESSPEGSTLIVILPLEPAQPLVSQAASGSRPLPPL